jgi:AraC-like DNA-binding protein
VLAGRAAAFSSGAATDDFRVAARSTDSMTPVPPARHLLRAKDLADARYREPLDVPALARAAHLSPAHFSREFRRAFGETPHQYLLTRRLERAAALLRNTDRSVADICLMVGLRSVGSFTTSFGRTYGRSPTAYRAAQAPAATRARIPTCVLQAWARPQSSTFREDSRAQADYRRGRPLHDTGG